MQGHIDWSEVSVFVTIVLALVGGAFGGKVVAVLRRPAVSRRATNQNIMLAIGEVKAQLVTVAARGEEMATALNGRRPSMGEPFPPPGIISQVAQHGVILRSLVPNGGNTDNPGDLLLKLAQSAGVTERG